jgi:hypothetical protein
MTDLTTTPEGQSGDPMDSDSDAGEIRPDPKRPRTRRRRWYLLAVIPVMLLTLMVWAASGDRGCTLGAIIPEPETGVSFELTPFLADAAMPVHVRACVRERYSTWRVAMPKPPSSCASFTVYALPGREALWRKYQVDPWDPRGVFIEDPPLTWEQPIAVRLTMKDQAGNSIFDSSAVVQPYTISYEPSCYGVIDVASVVATRPGRLAPYKVWEPNS